MQQIDRRTSKPKYDFNKVGFDKGVFLLHISRTIFPRLPMDGCFQKKGEIPS